MRLRCTAQQGGSNGEMYLGKMAVEDALSGGGSRRFYQHCFLLWYSYLSLQNQHLIMGLPLWLRYIVSPSSFYSSYKSRKAN